MNPSDNYLKALKYIKKFEGKNTKKEFYFSQIQN
jgi:hypothetical protein